MTDTDRMVVWLREAMDAAELAAQKAAELCGCHPPSPAWAFGDEATEGRILIVNDPHPGVKRKIHRRWSGSYEGLYMAEHIVRHDPAAVLHRIAADRKLLDDLLAEKHQTCEDEYYSCPAGDAYAAGQFGTQECTCGRDARVARRVRLLAESWGRTEETP
ncbi:DUF6221 family protein [Streptomyces sp. CBMA152]|uniref:DUF6221 family protein n=1 Tax=Streptomyces sp. CBMA152 TaxID=1896312 RepID=UPI00166133FF|nr:DUF6221 family protein [Streptomyces sp. CBMA152]